MLGTDSQMRIVEANEKVVEIMNQYKVSRGEAWQILSTIKAMEARDKADQIIAAAKAAHEMFDFRVWAQKSLAYALSLLKSG